MLILLRHEFVPSLLGDHRLVPFDRLDLFLLVLLFPLFELGHLLFKLLLSFILFLLLLLQSLLFPFLHHLFFLLLVVFHIELATVLALLPSLVHPFNKLLMLGWVCR